VHAEERVKNLSWWVPQVGQYEHDLIADVLKSNYLNEGEVTARFEQSLAQLIGCKHVVAVTSGTSAIFLALAALGIGVGDEVIVPDVTFIATANAVTMAGARPILVDVDPLTLTMDPQAFLRAITPRTKAVVPVHVSGRGADLVSINEIAQRHQLYVVEDAAEAFMSKLDGKCLGTFGIAGCLSFSPNKTITTGQGGAVLTDDDHLARRLRELKDQGRAVRGTGGDDLHPSIGYNFKFTNVQAAIGLGQLHYLESRLERMKEIYRTYVKRLSSVEGLSLPGFQLQRGESPQWTDAFVDRREELDRFLAQNGIQCRRFWFPVHTQPPYRLADDDFPNSTSASRKALWLPSAFTLSEEDVDTVCQHIQHFLGNQTPRLSLVAQGA
jgi:perosamine synthetase